MADVSKATPEDVHQAFTLLQHYAHESWQGKMVKPDDAVIMQSLLDVFCAGNFVKAVAYDGSEMVGIAFGFVGNTWWKRPCGSIDMFYVHPKMRGKGVSRKLLAECLSQFTDFDCGFVYAGAESGMGERNEALYVNLFKRAGFSHIGGGRLVKLLGE